MNRTHIFIFQFSESDHTLSHSLTGPGGKLPLPFRAPGLSERDSPSRPRPSFLQTQEGRRQAAAPASRPWSLGKGQPKPPAPQLFVDARRAAASCRSRFAPLVSRKGTAQAARAQLLVDARRAGLASRPPCLKKEIYEKETCTQNFSWKCLCSPTGPAPPYRWNQ